MMMDVMITGASGSLGSLFREFFSEHALTLVSRSTLKAGQNENWIQSEDLLDENGWAQFKFNKKYDLVLHLAEPVKREMTSEEIDRVVSSHKHFIANALEHSARVLYPLTAYRYDRNLGKKSATYTSIKERVFAENHHLKRVSFPVVHPLLDYGRGIHSIIQLEKRIPLVNVFCDFAAEMPVLYKRDLKDFLFLTLSDGVVDVYTRIIPISEVFSSQNRADIELFSCFVKMVAGIFPPNPSIDLLLHGRQIVQPTNFVLNSSKRLG
jgi:hypothetical protein